MLQGSHFLLLIHLSLAKSKLLELFYHIAREVREVSNLLGNYRHCEEQDSSLTLGTGSAIPEIDTHLSGARNDTLFMSLRGAEGDEAISVRA